jgi:hypothetical protein
MNTADLLARIYGHLGEGAETFWPAEELVVNALNPAQRLLVLLRPALCTTRTLLTVPPDTLVLDLRQVAAQTWRPQRVALGDVRTEDPVLSAGRVGDLRRITLRALRGQPDWMGVRQALPSHWYMHGAHLLGIWPRVAQPVLLTLVSAALPTPLSAQTPAQVPDVLPTFHPLIADVAAELARLKEGQTEVQLALTRLQALLGDEPFAGMVKDLTSQQARAAAIARRTATATATQEVPV